MNTETRGAYTHARKNSRERLVGGAGIVPETCPAINLSTFPIGTGVLDGATAGPTNDRLVDSGAGDGGLGVRVRTRPQVACRSASSTPSSGSTSEAGANISAAPVPIMLPGVSAVPFRWTHRCDSPGLKIVTQPINVKGRVSDEGTAIKALPDVRPGSGSPLCFHRLGMGRDAGAIDADGLTVKRLGEGRDDLARAPGLHPAAEPFDKGDYIPD